MLQSLVLDNFSVVLQLYNLFKHSLPTVDCQQRWQSTTSTSTKLQHTEIPRPSFREEQVNQVYFNCLSISLTITWHFYPGPQGPQRGLGYILSYPNPYVALWPLDMRFRLGLYWAILLGSKDGYSLHMRFRLDLCSKDGCLFYTYSLNMRFRLGL